LTAERHEQHGNESGCGVTPKRIGPPKIPPCLQARWAIETDTRRFKVGDGSTAWSSLSYYIEGVSGTRSSRPANTAGRSRLPRQTPIRALVLTATFRAAPTIRPCWAPLTTFAIRNDQRRYQAVFGAGQHGRLRPATTTRSGSSWQKMATAIDQSECRAFHWFTGIKLPSCSAAWMVELADNAEVAMYVANINDSNNDCVSARPHHQLLR
jgi:hypothetical protein